MTAKPQLSRFPEPLRSTCKRVLRLVCDAGGRPRLVGGCVRDALLGMTSKDIDIEVYGLPAEELQRILEANFGIELVGKAFCVFKIKGVEFDISLPRRETKTAVGHKGFAVIGEPNMSEEEATSRRDFTINSILWDPVEDCIIDPFGGRDDLVAGLLRHTSEQFPEDPLRVLRAMQLSARFQFAVHPETIAICSRIGPDGLPPERIFEEWKKLILKGREISLGLDFLRRCGWVRHYPELEALIDCRQDPEWHPEGDVWTHTLHSMDAFGRERLGEDWEDLVVGLAVLCHDFGKPATTVFERGHIRSPRHDVEGEKPTRAFLSRMTEHRDLIEQVVALVLTHLRPIELHRSGAGDSAVRRLARKVRRIDRLIRVARADMQGRPPLKGKDFPEGDWLLARAEALAVKDSAPRPIVMGRHLIELGQVPGAHFKGILDQCFEAQLDDAFSSLEEGIQFAAELIAGDGK